MKRNTNNNNVKKSEAIILVTNFILISNRLCEQFWLLLEYTKKWWRHMAELCPIRLRTHNNTLLQAYLIVDSTLRRCLIKAASQQPQSRRHALTLLSVYHAPDHTAERGGGRVRPHHECPRRRHPAREFPAGGRGGGVKS